MIHKQQKSCIKTIKTHHNQSKRPVTIYMPLLIPRYFIDVAILTNLKPKGDFNAYETRIYTLRFYFPSLFDTFNTFNTFKWCIMPSYESKPWLGLQNYRIKIIWNAKTYKKMTLSTNKWYVPYFIEAAISYAFWHGNQDDGDVTSCCAVTTRWHRQKQTALIADDTGIIWNIWNGPISDGRSWYSTLKGRLYL